MKNRITKIFPSLPFSSPFLTSLFPLFLTLLTLFATNVATAQIPSSGLVGYWPFSGNANDASGNGNNGTVNGATLTTDRFGNANRAYLFNGTSNSIVLQPNSNIQGNNPRSISFWANFSSGTANTHTVYKGGVNGSGNDFTIWLVVLSDNTYRLQVRRYQNDPVTIQMPVVVNQWIHFCVTYDGTINSNVKIYINGVQQTGITSTGGDNLTYNTLSTTPEFGHMVDQLAVNRYMNGKLDDISIYNRALTPSEISQLYTDQTSTVALPCTAFLGNDQTVCAGTTVTLSANSASNPCPIMPGNLQTGLVGYWPFCGNANDASGNGNNGTVNGPTLTTDRFGNANSAYSFDGVNDYIQANPSLLTQDYTFASWVFLNSTILGGNFIFSNLGSSPFYQGRELRVDANLLTNVVGGQNSWTHIYSSSLTLYENWFFVSVSAQGSNLKIYFNNQLVGEGVIQTINPGVQTYRFGTRDLTAMGGQLNGKIDDIVLYNRALTSSEIQQLYTLGQTTYLWSTGATTSSINVTPTQTTTYTCTVTDANGNTCTDSVTIYVPQIEATDLTICAGESTTLSVSGVITNACPTLPTNLQTGLVGYWPFCGNANDASGNGNNGTVNGAILTTDRFGNANSAYSFDGADQISIAQNPQISFGQNLNFTYSNWFYAPNSPNSNSEFRFFAAFGSSDNQNISVYSGGFQLGLINAGHNIYLELGASASEMFVSNFGVQLNTWHHFAISVDRNSDIVTVYLDGINIGTKSIPNSYNYTPCCNSPLLIGGERMYNQQHYFIGSIDDVAVFNRALNNSEIQQLYTLGQTTYLWSNGATAPTINVSPTTTTTYTCTVTTNGVSCTDSVTVVVSQPIASISPNGVVEICQGQSISLTGNGGVSYLWNTGAPTQSITVNTEAVYTVTVTDANGCTDTESQLVKVNFLPNITVNNATICAGQSASLTASGGVSYTWSTSTGLSSTSGSTVTATPAASTLYTVTGTGVNGCTNTAAAAVTVNALPTATITPATATTFCQGGSVVLNANSGTGLSYQWKLNGANITGATSASYTANASGSYTVVVTNASTCSSTSTATVVTVNALPTATITPATATTFCQGGSVVLNANTGTGLSYQWKLNGTNITGATSSSYTANASGSYTVVVTNASTCSSTSTATVVTVNALPTATITPATATTFCQSGSVVLNANTGTGLTYQWKLNGTNITGATSASYTANSSGSYTVTVTNASACSSTSTAVVVTVNALPTATITPATATTFCQGGSVVLNANTGTGLSYQWYNNASPISGATSASYTANASGSHTVTVTNTSTCSSTSTAEVVTTIANVDYFADADGDGFGDASTLISTCVQPQGYVTDNTDCDDTDATVNPSATEVCNHIDDDCNSLFDDGITFNTYYADNDGDTFGDLNNSIYECSQPAGYVLDNTDCNDANANQNSASTEICNGEDDDCDGTIDNGLVFLDYYADLDSDGFGSGAATNSCVDLGAGYVTNNADCNNANANINPNATELCNSIDDNCNGQVDEGITFTTYYQDFDNDGFGTGDAVTSCSNPGAGWVTNNTDCDDTNANTFPGANEICNTIDDNCDGQADEGLLTVYFIDNDGDTYGNPSVSILACTQPVGYTPDDTDCNDTDASINPGAEDIAANGIDENCDGQIDNSIFELDASINLYPNPTRSELNIQISNALVGNDMYIFDAVGKLVYKQKLLSTQTTLSMSEYAVGNYIFRIGELVKRFVIQ